MKQLEVQIMGQSYLLGCPEDGDALMLDAVNRVDMAMCKIRDVGKIKARDRIAVLAALNLAFELSEHSIAGPLAGTSADRKAGVPQSVHADGAATQAHPQLTALLQRLDAALDADGQLL
jgi:cell division protein ZapA